ncbi:hypothetical protein, partial [Roseiconus lacunae]
ATPVHHMVRRIPPQLSRFLKLYQPVENGVEKIHHNKAVTIPDATFVNTAIIATARCQVRRE